MIDPASFKQNIHDIDDQARFRFDPDLIPPWFRKAAVLVLFFEEGGIIRVVLTKRSEQLNSHKGEVCFPGGRKEEGESPIETALREAEEEIGLDRNRVKILGKLDDGWSRASYHMIPVIGWFDGVPTLVANSNEVSKILIPDIRDLYDTNNRTVRTAEKEGVIFNATIISHEDAMIFGQTADILLEALEKGNGLNLSRGRKRAETLRKALGARIFDSQKS